MTRIIPALVLAIVLMVGITALYIRATAPVPEPGEPDDGIAAEGLNATLWVQTSAEYKASALQAYALATVMLDRALADSAWTAALEQDGAAALTGLPPAVILDVDETVLDNSPSQARLILDDAEFGRDNWNRWVLEAQARPIAGAVEFTTRAASLGVTVFYVTNRNQELEEATRRNLAVHGFPIDSTQDVVLTRGEEPDWGSDKGTRRARVAGSHRILLLIGDNLGDFRSGVDTTPGERDAQVEAQTGWWGSRWIVLPNPQYGSWDGALIGYEYGLSPAQKLALKIGALVTARGAEGGNAR